MAGQILLHVALGTSYWYLVSSILQLSRHRYALLHYRARQAKASASLPGV